jgi:hypothetical protein
LPRFSPGWNQLEAWLRRVDREEFDLALGYVLVVLGNTDSDGTQTIATHARDLIAASVRR